MAVAAPVKSFTDTTGRLPLYPCLCLDYSMSSSRFNAAKKRRQMRKLRMLELSSSFTRMSAANKMLSSGLRKRQKPKGLIVIDDLGGQYDDTFVDVKLQIMDYFTVKAVRTVLDQLYETNPLQYHWFNSFIAENTSKKSKQFLQILVKERRDFAERVMITRLALYSRWIKKCNHEETYKEIEEENLMLMRERLLETIVWPSDDHNNPNPNLKNAD